MFRVVIASFIMIIFATSSFAIECKQAEWPYKKNQLTKDFHQLFKLNSNQANIDYLMFEITKPTQSKLEKSLFKYLIFNSDDQNVGMFLKAIEWARTKNKITAISNKDFCSLYKRTLELN
jgi:hypothetical protein